MPSVRDSAPYASFWQAGYEGADHINQAGVPLQLNRDTGHLQRAREDYDLLQQFGIRTVRESAGWRLCERDGRYDFSSLDSRLRAARELGLQICWTFCHYGWPQDLDFLGPEFVPRFARYCRALAEYLAPWAGPQPVYTPLNEISFTSWNLTRGQFYCMNMHDPRAGHEGKRQLVRAQLAGCDAIRAVTPGARFLVTDPLIHITAPSRRPDLRPLAAALNASQFEAWDMLSGRAAPELGGAPDYLDLIGANYYHSNQWECCDDQRLWWHLGDPLRAPLHRLLTELHHRYGRPLLLAETSHVGSGRGAWLRDVASEAVLAVQHGADLRGVCLYPVVDRPDWEDPRHWHRAGLWDMDRHGPDPLARRLVQPYADALRQAQELTTRLCTCADTQMRDMPTIVVFSHLRWDAFSHRPQQLLTRLAPYYRIVYVEEPVHGDGGAYLVSSAPAPNVTVVRPHTPAGAGGFGDGQLAALQPLLAGLAPPGADVIAWFCTPMALPLLPALDARLVVYDCIDELSAHRHAPRQLPQREKALLTIADLVFTAGPGLHRARRAQHPAVHCFPGSVDAIHFEQALDRDNTHPAHDAIAHPRLGYHGPFDECVDTTLLAAIADARPDWQLVMVGSVREAAALTLPRRPNIHYLGRQPYQAIPHLLAGWDVCLLPLALNHATRHANPAQVLEYMAAALPIVSTDIADIRQAYGDVVRICRTHGQFIAACDDALALPPEHRDAMALRMRDIVGRSSWQATADAMRALLDSTPARQGGSAAPTPRAADNPVPAGCVVIGAGPTGLSAAYHLDAGTLLLERQASVGGGCRSMHDQGFIFDRPERIACSDDAYVLHMYERLLGDNQHWQTPRIGTCGQHAYTPNQPPHADSGSRFGYPLRGGLQALMAGFLPHIRGKVELRAEVAVVLPAEHALLLTNGRRQQYDQLISTVPLPELVRLTGGAAPAGVKRAAGALRHVSLRCVNLGIDRPGLTDKHWIDYPEDTIFQRIFVQGNASNACNAPGGFGFTCEIAYSPARPLPLDGDGLIARCLEDCVRTGFLRADDRVLAASQLDLPYARAVYDDTYDANVTTIRDWMAHHDILLAGRHGAAAADAPEHAFLAGRRIAETVLARRTGTRRAAAT